MRYKKYDIIMFKKIHYSAFIQGMKNRKKFSDRLATEKNVKWLYKMRPAIVLKSFKPEWNDNSGRMTRYLIAPLTSKNTIRKWDGAEELLRIKLDNENLKKGNGDSFIMLDSIMTIYGEDIDCLYNNKGSAVKLTTSERRWLKKQLKNKFKLLMKSI